MSIAGVQGLAGDITPDKHTTIGLDSAVRCLQIGSIPMGSKEAKAGISGRFDIRDCIREDLRQAERTRMFITSLTTPSAANALRNMTQEYRATHCLMEFDDNPKLARD